MAFRLLHTADLHLEAPFVGAGTPPRPLARRLARAGLDTLDRLVELALERSVDALVVAGGLLPPVPQASTLARVRSALRVLDAAGVSTVLVGHAGEPLEDLLVGESIAGVTSVGPGPVQVVPVTGRAGGGVAVEVLAASGLDGLRRLTEHPLSVDGPPRVAVCALAPPRPDDPGPPALDGVPIGYWALGGRWPATLAHLPDSDSWVAMAGTPQLHGFAEPGVVAGPVLVDGDPGGSGLRGAPTWLTVAAVEPVTVTVPLSRVSDVEQLVGRLRETGRELAVAFPGRLVVARATIDGVGSVRLALVDPLVRAWVLDTVRAAEEKGAESGDGRIWWADLVLSPLPGRAAEPLIRTDRLAEAAVRIGRTVRIESPGDVLSRARAAVGLPGGGAPPPGPAWAGLVRDATSVVLDLVGGERACA